MNKKTIFCSIDVCEAGSRSVMYKLPSRIQIIEKIRGIAGINSRKCLRSCGIVFYVEIISESRQVKSI